MLATGRSMAAKGQKSVHPAEGDGFLVVHSARKRLVSYAMSGGYWVHFVRTAARANELVLTSGL